MFEETLTMTGATFTVYVLITVSFFNGLQMSIYYATLWPFITTIDPTVTVVFFGYITSAFSIGQCISSVLLGFWLDYSKSVRAPLIFGLLLLVLANIIFCIAEFLPPYARWILFTSRLFLGFGSGVRAILRAVIPSVSTNDGIAKVIAMVQGAYSLGAAIGPLLQFGFILLGSPRLENPLRLDMYNIGALMMLVINMLLLIPVFMIRNDYSREKRSSESDSIDSEEETKIDYLNVGMCIFTVFMAQLIAANIDSTLSAYSELMWHWTKEQNAKYTGYFHSVHGFVQILAFVLFSTKLDHLFIGRRSIFGAAFAMLLGIVYYWLTFPVPFLEESLDCIKYAWCTDTPAVNLWLYFFAFTVILAICYPIITVTTNVIFNESVGHRPQGILQGISLSLSNTAKVVGPLILTELFTHWGPRSVNLFMISLLASCMGYWLFSYIRKSRSISDNNKC